MKNNQNTKLSVVMGWIIVLLISVLPKVLLQEVFQYPVSSEVQLIFSLSVIAAGFLGSLFWQPLRGLRQMLVLFLVLVVSQYLVYNHLDRLPFYKTWLSNPSFSFYMLAEQSLNLVITLVMILTLLLMRKKPREFYLAVGNIAAPAEPIRWLGVKAGDSWKSFGAWLTLFISLGTLTFLIIVGRPPLDIAVQALPFLPAILLAATLNAFNEEVTYKASFLSVLENPVGTRQALYMVAVYFGLGHFYGVPYGVIGVVLATFLGWILAKSMQETEGLFWAWFIHFWQDVWIFSFLAIGSIVPGGK